MLLCEPNKHIYNACKDAQRQILESMVIRILGK